MTLEKAGGRMADANLVLGQEAGCPPGGPSAMIRQYPSMRYVICPVPGPDTEFARFGVAIGTGFFGADDKESGSRLEDLLD